MKETVEGILLIISCQKHKDTRLKEFRVPKDKYVTDDGIWKVIYVIGDLFQEQDFKIVDENVMYVKCEDSYVHLLKKVVLSIKHLYSLFEIKQGVFRLGDDLIYNEYQLVKFLQEKNKDDYIGKCGYLDKYISSSTHPHLFQGTMKDNFMVDYYRLHPEDFENPQHNLKNVNMEVYNKRPRVPAAFGMLFYLSNKSCQILINHMESIQYDIFKYDSFLDTYPYFIEDIGVAFILLCKNSMRLKNDHRFEASTAFHQYSNGQNIEKLVFHTNMYK